MSEKFENTINNEQAILDEVENKKNFLFNLEDKTVVEIYRKIYDFEKKLEEKYPDASKYYLFHIVAGGTINRRDCSSGFDFPGDDSIAKYLDILYKEYKAE